MTTPDIRAEIERQDQLESDQHFFEMFMSDHIENQVQRMMECTPPECKIRETPLTTTAVNLSLVDTTHSPLRRPQRFHGYPCAKCRFFVKPNGLIYITGKLLFVR